MSARPRLRLVAPEQPPEKPGRWQGRDPVFFHRDQVRVGVVLECFGRIDHATRWRVVEVKRERKGRLYTVPSGRVEHISDTLVLVRLGGNETRRQGFAYLSYSAIWRLSDYESSHETGV